MSELAIDPIEMAKAMQMEIEFLDDPIEAALKGHESVELLNQLVGSIWIKDNFMVIHAFSAYVFPQRSMESDHYQSVYYDDRIVATGKYAGKVGFIQNVGKPRMQTLFIALQDARVMEAQAVDPEAESLRADHYTERLVVPVLELDQVRAA